LEKNKAGVEKELAAPGNDVASPVPPEVEALDEGAIVRFSNASNPIACSVEFDQISGERGTPFSPSDVTTTRVQSREPCPLSRSDFRHNDLDRLTFVPRSPEVNPDSMVQLFLCFHRQKIVAGHYFLYEDAEQFLPKGLPEMAEKSVCLQYAVASFSALVCSVHIDRWAKNFAVIYYAEALRKLRELLATTPTRQQNFFPVLATSLQLGSVEV